MDKDVSDAIGVAVDEIAGKGREGNKTAVAADARGTAVAIPLNAAAVDGDAASCASLTVVDKDVLMTLGVAADEVAGIGGEGDKTAVAADARAMAIAISLAVAATHGDAADCARLAVVDKDIATAIGVAADKVAGIGSESNKTAVAANTGRITDVIPLNAAAVDEDVTGCS